MSASMAICSSETAEPLAFAARPAGLAARAAKSIGASISVIRKKGGSIRSDSRAVEQHSVFLELWTLTRIIHVCKEPVHGRLGVSVARGQKRFLTTNNGKAHALELGHRSRVELRRLHF
jgi:hypothetical protein